MNPESERGEGMEATVEHGSGTDLVQRTPQQAQALAQIMSTDELQRTYKIASTLAQSGVFKDAKQASTAFAKMVIGRELGLGIAQSMIGLHLVEGGIMVHYATLLRFVRSQPGCDYRIREHTEEKCRIDWIRDGEVIGSSEYTREDADKAGLTKPTRSGAPSMYDKHPKNMLLARCVSNGVKFHMPEALAGIPIYVRGELPDEHYVDGAPAEEAPAPPELSLADVVADVPEDLHERLYAAFAEGRTRMPGRYTPAAIQMSVRGKTPEEVEAYIAEMEAEVAKAPEAPAEPAEADEPSDAVVVEDEDTEGSADEATAAPAAEDGEATAAPEPTAEEKAAIESVTQQLSLLYDQLSDHDANPDADPEVGERLNREISEKEKELAELGGGEQPGQEALL